MWNGRILTFKSWSSSGGCSLLCGRFNSAQNGSYGPMFLLLTDRVAKKLPLHLMSLEVCPCPSKIALATVPIPWDHLCDVRVPFRFYWPWAPVLHTWEVWCDFLFSSPRQFPFYILPRFELGSLHQKWSFPVSSWVLVVTNRRAGYK